MGAERIFIPDYGGMKLSVNYIPAMDGSNIFINAFFKSQEEKVTTTSIEV